MCEICWKFASGAHNGFGLPIEHNEDQPVDVCKR